MNLTLKESVTAGLIGGVVSAIVAVLASDPTIDEEPSAEEPSVPEAHNSKRIKSPAKLVKNKPLEAVEAVKETPATPAAPRRRYEDLWVKLSQLKASPENTKLRVQLHDRIETEAEKLPLAARNRITMLIEEAVRSNEVDGLKESLDELERDLRVSFDAGHGVDDDFA